MKTHQSVPDDKGYRFPPEIISHCVWLYFRFSFSFRDGEELMAQRGVVLTSETVRQWCLKFGQSYANELRHRRPRCGDTWHRDEVVLTIRGKKHSLWRAVDQDGNMLDILAQSRRNKKAAKRSAQSVYAMVRGTLPTSKSYRSTVPTKQQIVMTHQKILPKNVNVLLTLATRIAW
jgi:transposase-like protein